MHCTHQMDTCAQKHAGALAQRTQGKAPNILSQHLMDNVLDRAELVIFKHSEIVHKSTDYEKEK